MIGIFNVSVLFREVKGEGAAATLGNLEIIVLKFIIEFDIINFMSEKHCSADDEEIVMDKHKVACLC